MGHPERIEIDGREYEDVQDMPAETRRIYELAVKHVPGARDVNGDGAPDVPSLQIRTSVDTRIVVNGRTYRSLDEVPAEIRREIEQAMRGGSPPGASFILPHSSDPSVGIRLVQSIEPGRSNSVMLRLAIVLALVVGVALVALMLLGSR